MAPGSPSSKGILILSLLSDAMVCGAFNVNLNSVVMPVVKPRGSMRNWIKFGRDVILICIPVDTTVVGALGCDIETLKAPAASNVYGFLS